MEIDQKGLQEALWELFFGILFLVFVLGRFWTPFWCHVGSPNGVKLSPKNSKNRKEWDQKRTSSPRRSKTPLRVVLGRSLGYPGRVLGWPGRGLGQPRRAFWERFGEQQSVPTATQQFGATKRKQRKARAAESI